MEGVIVVSVIKFSETDLAHIYVLQGFDEYMNVVLDDACEVHVKTGTRKPVGESKLPECTF